MNRPGRRKDKEEYVEATESLLGEFQPELHEALKSLKNHQLIMLAKSIADRHGVQMPKFPTKTDAQKLRLFKTLTKLKETKDESGTISTDTI